MRCPVAIQKIFFSVSKWWNTWWLMGLLNSNDDTYDLTVISRILMLITIFAVRKLQIHCFTIEFPKAASQFLHTKTKATNNFYGRGCHCWDWDFDATSCFWRIRILIFTYIVYVIQCRGVWPRPTGNQMLTEKITERYFREPLCTLVMWKQQKNNTHQMKKKKKIKFNTENNSCLVLLLTLYALEVVIVVVV